MGQGSMEHGPDPPAQPSGTEPEGATQRIARAVLAAALILLGLWILHRYLVALAWAAVLAIALWPLYQRLVRAIGGAGQRVLGPLVFTLLIGLVFIVPFVYAAVEVARETHVLVQYLVDARHTGIPVPQWIPQLPGVGYPIEEWWRNNLSDPKAAEELLGRIYARVPAESARDVAGQIIHRLILFGFTLLTLFFLFRDGAAFSRRLIALSDRLLGAQGERIGRHMVHAVLGTVNGLVLVGLGEGLLLGVAYILAGLPHAVPIAVLTGVLAVIPFGAPVVFGAAALYLAATGSTAAAAAVFGFGVAVVFVADHFVRPVLIGGAARLPFLWVLLGILGGLEAFGILGLFLGPAVVAALISLWREWTDVPVSGDRPGMAQSETQAPQSH
jgi:predicted PurR-regulated permease PerM